MSYKRFRLTTRLVAFWLVAAVGLMSGQGCPSASTVPGPQGPAGPPGATGATGAQGDIGPQGPPGPSGNLRIYGDGSAGALVIPDASIANWLLTPPTNNNTQFTDVTIGTGAILFVPSGTIIRCTGTFTNNGAILVGNGAHGGEADVDTTTGTVFDREYAPPGQGIAHSLPGAGEVSSPTAGNPRGGLGGAGLASAFAASFLLYPGAEGGGGGAASTNGTTEGTGGDGGGAFTVLAKGAITNLFTITATGMDGDTGSGGGGGGVVILASVVSITHNAGTALIDVRGGAGGLGDTQVGAGGGGGGGIVHLIAPTINTAPGNANVAGGTRGAAASIRTNPHQAGAGGGGSGGSGGTGGPGIVPIATPANGNAGTPGFFIQSLQDPTSLF